MSSSTEAVPFARWTDRKDWTPLSPHAGGGAWRAQIDPGTGQQVADVRDMSGAEVRRHVSAVARLYRAATSPSRHDRAALMRSFANVVEAHADALGELDARCTGKLRADAVATAHGGARILRYYAELVSGDDDPYHEALPSPDARTRQWVDRLPVGVVASVLPWNYPISQACARVAMSLVAGNAAVLKGSELAQPPLLALEELAREAGLPAWAFSVVSGGPDAGAALVEAPEVDAICFTGGVPTGVAVAQRAAATLKRVVLELGGKTPFVVFADADEDAALEAAIRAGFGFQGQACHAGSLLLIERSRFDELLGRFVSRVRTLRLGHQLDHDTELGPVVSSGQRARIAQLVDDAGRRSATILTGGRAPDRDGFFYEPTVITGLAHDAAAAREELFGPVVVAQPFDDESEIVSLVNDSRFGLAASIWTRDPRRANRVGGALRTGIVYVNTHGPIAPNAPWGGFRMSGLGRLYGTDGLLAFTEARQTYGIEAQL